TTPPRLATHAETPSQYMPHWPLPTKHKPPAEAHLSEFLHRHRLRRRTCRLPSPQL
ncbi:hypothetical protein E4U16_004085, partial [Claviceps sp. LM84 group G4]